MVAVSEHLDRFGDAEVVVVSFAEPERIAEYRRHLGVPFRFVADPDRRLYAALGAGRGTRRQVWSPGTIRLYLRLVRSGRRLQRPSEGIYQLGADAVIGRDGRLRYLAPPPSPDTRPPITDLIAALG